jgi:hypothetical protein
MAPAVVTGDYFIAVKGAPVERGVVVVHGPPPSARQPD